MNHLILDTEYDLDSISTIARHLIQLNQKIMVFDAPMGAGKTTLIKEICKQLGSVDNFSSPTYQLVNEYVFSTGKIYHFDLYRLKTLEELLNIGFDDYINTINYCLIEWPALAEDYLQSNYIKVTISMLKNSRSIKIIKL